MHPKGRLIVQAFMEQKAQLMPDVWWRESGAAEDGTTERKAKLKGEREGVLEFKQYTENFT